MEVKSLCTDMYRIRDFFPIDQLYSIADEFNKYHPTYVKKEKSNHTNGYYEGVVKGPSRIGDNLSLIAPSPNISLVIKKIIKPEHNIKLYRVNTNIMHPGQSSDFHTDSGILQDNVMEYGWTFLLFCSMEWNTHWGGEFCFQSEDGEYNYCPYIPGDCILFRACRQHRACETSLSAQNPRHTVAWTFSSPGIIDNTY